MSYQPSEKQLAWYARGEEGMQLALQLIAEGELSVDAEGRIWRHKYRGQPCRPPRRCDKGNGSGHYLMVHLTVDGKRQRVQAHRLAWTVLKGPIPPGMQINHLNGDKRDNRPENMEVTDNCGNQQHRCRVLGKKSTPPRNTGEKHGMSKLTAVQVAEMRYMHATGKSLQDLMDRFGVGHSQATRIVKRQNWKEI